MFEFLSEFAGFAVEMIFWYIVLQVILGWMERRMSERNEEMREVIERVSNIVHRVRVEQHGEIYYWYDEDNDDFLAQGKDLEEATNHLRARFPGHLFFVTHKDNIYKISAPSWELEHVNSKSISHN